MASSVPNVTLNNGLQMPVLGLGTWKSKPGEVTKAVKDAIDVGYRHFDCAHVYQNEPEVGAGLKAKFDEGVVKREEVWITSKLWNTFHRADLVEGALRTTLKSLGLQYLDLYLIHWPQAFKEGSELFPSDGAGGIEYSEADYVDTWKAMEKCVEKGLTKSIGLSNFNTVQIERVLKVATVKPVTNQVECHPYLNQKRLAKFCKDRGMVLTAYSPLGSPDRPWAKPDDPQLLQDPKLVAIAARINKTPAQVLLRYQIQAGNVAIPKSVTQARIQENFQVFDFKLSEDDVKTIDTFDVNGRVCFDGRLKNHPHYPFNIDY